MNMAKKVCNRQSSVLSSAHVCNKKLQEFREHVHLTSYITILSVWFGLPCNFLLETSRLMQVHQLSCLSPQHFFQHTPGLQQCALCCTWKQAVCLFYILLRYINPSPFLQRSHWYFPANHSLPSSAWIISTSFNTYSIFFSIFMLPFSKSTRKHEKESKSYLKGKFYSCQSQEGWEGRRSNWFFPTWNWLDRLIMLVKTFTCQQVDSPQSTLLHSLSSSEFANSFTN